MAIQCTVCQTMGANVFIEAPQVPVVCNVLWPTQASARAARRVDISLAFCPHCAHIFNPCFDPTLVEYSAAYENSLHFSPRFQSYIEQLGCDLVTRNGLHHKTLVEIGGGKGDFLRLLCDLGDNRGVSIDPSYAPAPSAGPTDERLTFIQDYYSEKYAGLRADFIASRHTLEHIQHPVAFLTTLRRTVGDQGSILFFEIPNARFTLHDLAIWDIIYEHCSYFTTHSLGYLFASCGFAVTSVQATFADQFLCIEATPSVPQTVFAAADRQVVADAVATFAERYRQKMAEERLKLAEWFRAKHRVVIWGAGSKGITYLNLLGLHGEIDYAVDINPRKQGMYLTGGGQQIVPPAFLQEYQPSVVLVMNPVYLDEIRQTLDELQVQVELVPAL